MRLYAYMSVGCWTCIGVGEGGLGGRCMREADRGRTRGREGEGQRERPREGEGEREIICVFDREICIPKRR